MKRLHRVLLGLGLASLVWMATVLAVKSSGSDVVRCTVLTLPVMALALYALYVLLSLAYGVATFRTVPEEGEALRAEIAEAHTFLQQKGVSIQ